MRAVLADDLAAPFRALVFFFLLPAFDLLVAFLAAVFLRVPVFFGAAAFFRVGFLLVFAFFLLTFFRAAFLAATFFFADFFPATFFRVDFFAADFLRADDFFFAGFFAATFLRVTFAFLPVTFLRPAAFLEAAFLRAVPTFLRCLLAAFFAGIVDSCRSEKNAELYIGCRHMEAQFRGFLRRLRGRRGRASGLPISGVNAAAMMHPAAHESIAHERRKHAAVFLWRQSFYRPIYITLHRFPARSPWVIGINPANAFKQSQACRL